MRNEESNQFIGFMVSGFATAVLLYIVVTLGIDGGGAKKISDLSPWLGSHLAIIRYLAIALILAGGAMFSFRSMMRDDGHLEFIGFFTRKIFAAIFIPAMCFAAGALWWYCW